MAEDVRNDNAAATIAERMAQETRNEGEKALWRRMAQRLGKRTGDAPSPDSGG